MNSVKKKSRYVWAYGFIAPTMIGLIILNIIPLFQTIYFSFFRSGAFGKNYQFVGLDSYKQLIKDPQVWQAAWNTLKYTMLVVPITVIIALVLAVLLNSKLKGRHVYRTIYFLPMVAAPAAVTMVWKWLYNNQFGLINVILSRIGFEPVNWIEDPKIAIYAISVIGIWSTVGYSMVLLLSGLQEIPSDFYEAAKIDGASWMDNFFKITIPLLSPQLFFVFVTSIIQGLQVFDVIYMMISPAFPSYDKTVSLVYLFYNNTFKYGNKAYGSAIVVFLLIITMFITVIQMKLQKKWVNYMGEG